MLDNYFCNICFTDNNSQWATNEDAIGNKTVWCQRHNITIKLKR